MEGLADDGSAYLVCRLEHCAADEIEVVEEIGVTVLEFQQDVHT